MFYDDDADLTLLDGKTVAIIGFGSQGHAHALNLKDSGVDVVVGLREGSSSVEQARKDGLEVVGVADAASRGDVVMVLVPDELHHDVYESEIRDALGEGACARPAGATRQAGHLGCAPCITTTTQTSASSTARPSPSSATARRAMPTR